MLKVKHISVKSQNLTKMSQNCNILTSREDCVKNRLLTQNLHELNKNLINTNLTQSLHNLNTGILLSQMRMHSAERDLPELALRRRAASWLRAGRAGKLQYELAQAPTHKHRETKHVKFVLNVCNELVKLQRDGANVKC